MLSLQLWKRQMSFGELTFLLCLISALVGCSKRTNDSSDIESTLNSLVASPKAVLSISPGLSLEAVRRTLAGAVCHEFTVAEPDAEYTLIGCRVSSDDYPALFMLFCNKRLSKFIVPVPTEVELYAYQGTTASRTKPWDIDDMERVRKAIESPALDREQLLAEFHGFRPKNGGVSERIGSLIWDSEMRGFDRRMASRTRSDYAMNQALLRRYDGCRVDLGMDAGQVERVYGAPLKIFSKAGETIRVFGERRNLEVNPAHIFTCVAVVFDSRGRATRVYSNNFFNNDWGT